MNYSITVLNSSNLSIYFSIFYNIKDNGFTTKDSPKFDSGIAEGVTVPDNAYAILIRVFYYDANGKRIQLATENFVYPSNKCYEVFGPPDHMEFHEIQCSEITGNSYMYIFNKSDQEIKGILVYTVGKEGFRDESIPIKNGRGRAFIIPVHATLVYFYVYVLDSYDSSGNAIWNPLFKLRIFKRPYKKCYNIVGTKGNVTYMTYPCPN